MQRDKNAVKNLQNYLIGLGCLLPKFGADGDMGEETLKAIDSLNFPSFVKSALKEVGVKEIVGSSHESRVLEYQKTTAGKYSDDETPWCGAFVSWVMKQAGINHGLKTPERAKDWSSFGYAVNEPTIGSVAVKSRVGGGHVCIVIGKQKDGKLLCVGGNQNNEVNIHAYDKSVFESFRNYDKVQYPLVIVSITSGAKVTEA